MSNLSQHCLRQSSRELASMYYRQQDPLIISTLFQRHYPQVYQDCLTYLSYPVEAEDASMEVFELLHHHLRQYRIRRFTQWLAVICRNHCTRRKKETARRITLLGSLPPNCHMAEPAMHRKRELELQYQCLYAGLNTLKEHQRQCLLHFYFGKQTYREIAATLGHSRKEVRSYLENGRRNLRNYLCERL